MWDLMHECFEIYSQIKTFVILNLLHFMIANHKLINFAFFLPKFLFFGHEGLGSQTGISVSKSFWIQPCMLNTLQAWLSRNQVTLSTLFTGVLKLN